MKIYDYYPQLLLLFGMILTFVAGFISFNNDRKSQIENDILSKKNSEMNETIKNILTGGDSFCYVDVNQIGESEKRYYFLNLKLNGEYPLSNVSFTYWLPDEIDKISNKDSRIVTPEILKLYKNISVGSVNKNSIIQFDNLSFLEENDLLKINFSISTNNGLYYQKLRIYKIDGDYKVATIVNKSNISKALIDSIDNGFPIKYVDWK